MTIANEDLINIAREAREQAYCRYSKYSVGAAIIDDAGRLHVGCNVENAAYNLGNCAEAAAIAAMIQEGGNRIERIAVAGGYSEIGPCTPCGGCRQRIKEFADENTVVIVIDDSNEWQEYSIDTLLPASFHLD
ncbi:MAG: cytidine deaminase [Gammaproteobacteria bacterium]|nr:cytidine deaminase [Gammaproteobacteria bacterium]